jgi:hypothetical protein
VSFQKRFLVFVGAGGTMEDVIPNEVHRGERFATAVERLEDNLGVVILRERYDDEAIVLEEHG